MSQPSSAARVGTARRLTAVLVVLLVVVSAGGAFGTAWLYRDNPLISATFRGQDWVTLLVAVPLLVTGLVLERRGSRRGRLLWLAMLFSVMYSYLFYAVGAAFNVFFLLYVAIVALALYALLLATWGMELEPLAAAVGGRVARGLAIGYMLWVAAGLGLLWTGMSLSFLFTGIVPAAIVASGHPTGVVFAIDLVFIVPPMLVGAVGLIRNRASGWVLAAVMSVSGAVYTLSLAAASISVVQSGAGTADELPLWAVLTLFGVATAWLIYAGRTRVATAVRIEPALPSAAGHGRPPRPGSVGTQPGWGP
ncbi:MAG: hypothetical protein ACOH1Y_06270, partial [Propionicimonas sp.]